jgi:hypothetical protein
VDSETGDTTFDVLSNAGLARNREMYPIPIENDSGADEWYEAPGLTTDLAAWHYIVWHTTVALITDWYWSTNGYELRAMDFDAGDIYSTIDAFYQDRLFARLLCDRYGRFSMPVDIQMETAGAAPTTFTLTTADWLDSLDFRETIETSISYVELGALNYTGGLITPYLSKAPGTVNRLMGSNMQSMNLAIDAQATLNTLAGDWLAYLNNLYPEATISLAGNWRYFDIWPQEYVVVNTVTDRHTFASDNFIVRGVSIGYDSENGGLFVTLDAELETDGVDGQTVEIPTEIPPWTPPPPIYPPSNPPTPWTPNPGTGRRMISTDVGVFCTDDISSASPIWYAVNAGFVAAEDLYVGDIKRDPWHWWTTDDERVLWAATTSGIWKHEGFPTGTWVQVVTYAQLLVALGANFTSIYEPRLTLSIEVDELMASVLVGAQPAGNPLAAGQYVGVMTYQGGVIQTANFLGAGANFSPSWPSMEFAPHGAGNTIYTVRGHRDPASGYEVWKTTNQGVGWSMIDNPAATLSMQFSSLAIPYISATSTDQYIYWGYFGRDQRISINAGTTFSDFVAGTGYSKMGTGYSQDHVWLLQEGTSTQISRWTNNGGITWFDLPLTPDALFGTFSAFGSWTGDQLEELLIGGMLAGTPYIYQWRNGWTAWQDKTGNLADIASISIITQLDRDSTGTA